MGLRNVQALTLAVAAAAVLSGCSFAIAEPKDGATVRLPAKTKVMVRAKPSMSNLVVMVTDQNKMTKDVSSQLVHVPANGEQVEGDLILPAGTYSITATADIPPTWYSPHHSDQAKFCVAAPWPSTSPTFTAFRKGSTAQSWNKMDDTTVVVDADTGTPQHRWNLERSSGSLTPIGIIRSTENTCLCMQSMDATSGTPIGLAICDPANPLQQWLAFQISTDYRFQNQGRNVNDNACLSEEAGKLIQRGCDLKDEQLWRIRNNASGNLVSPF